MEQNFAVLALAKCPLFAHASATTLESVAGSLRRRRFRRNEVIFHQGDPGDSLHIVASGAVKIVLPSAEGEEAIIATLREGDFFGELSLLDRGPRSATVIANTDMTLVVLGQREFLGVIDEVPVMAHKLLAALAGRLREADSAAVALSH